MLWAEMKKSLLGIYRQLTVPHVPTHSGVETVLLFGLNLITGVVHGDSSYNHKPLLSLHTRKI